MENKKLISARLDPQTLENIEKFQRSYTFMKRNTVISHVLDAVFDNFDNKSIYAMICYCRHTHKNASGSFSLSQNK